MIDKSILDKLKNKPVLPEEITRTITSKAILVGSALFGGFTPKSDIDYIIPSDFPYTWTELCEYGVVSNTNNYSNMELSSMYVKTLSNCVLNLLFINPNFYDIWIKAKEIMTDIIDSNIDIHNLIQNKENRVSLFETIKEMLVKEECNKPVKE